MAKNLLVKLLLILSACTLMHGCYQGDGIYTSEGVILKNHKLTLPLGSPGEEGHYEFFIEGFVLNPEAVQMSMLLKSPHPKRYWEIKTVVELEIYDVKAGQVLYSKRSVLPEYYIRAKELENQKYNQGDWSGIYKYDTDLFDSHAMPFHVPKNIEPVPQNEIKFLHLYPSYNINWKSDYRITVNFIDPDERFKDVSAALIFAAGPI